MTRPLIVEPVPQALPSAELLALDRAVGLLRRGGMVRLVDGQGVACLMLAAEGANDEALARLAVLSGSVPAVVLTARRAGAYGLLFSGDGPVLARAPAGLDASLVAGLADPLQKRAGEKLALDQGPASAFAAAAVALVKIARLLPAAVLALPAQPGSGIESLPAVPTALALSYPADAAASLRQVAEARVPLSDAEDTRIVAFRPADGGIEHLAIVIGAPDRDGPVLTRLHSECFTGDLLGSLRCDCGDQLRGAIGAISQAGGGVLLYLAQEGRGIGLVNKLRAYQLQDQGFDTLDANLQLGFDDDERVYLPAAEMLKLMGIERVRLLTNNPAKVAGLARFGIEVTERVPHVYPANPHNERYLETKAKRSGHLF